MNPTALASLTILVAYLVGAIPFAYLFVKAAKGIDIRTVGSGNVGATNASRVLGLRGFLLVFFCDLLKGLIPTVVLPALVTWKVGHPVLDLPILVALAAILGHNFPIYLNFRGGKGVSTSLGAALGLDWIASLASLVAFGISLRINRYVSLSSLLGAIVFTAVHFAGVLFFERKSPWDREHLALSLLTLGLLTMMLVRHRKNFARIVAGTEPKVSRKRRPSGKVAIAILATILAAGVGVLFLMRASEKITADCGAFTLTEVARARTNHQRATHPVFADSGRTLAAICPRYNRLMIYGVSAQPALQLVHDITLEGQPMALAASEGIFWVLQRPSGDERHIKKGFVRGYRSDGREFGPRIEVGFYPTEIVVRDGKTALVLTQGRVEGEPHHGFPMLECLDLTSGEKLATLPFDQPKDSPSRLSVSDTGVAVAVALPASGQVAAIDLTDPRRPRMLGRSALPVREFPYPSRSSDDCLLMPVGSERQWAKMSNAADVNFKDSLSDLLVSVCTEASEVEVRGVQATTRLGVLPLRGSGNLGEVRPTGVAYSPERGLIGITNRSGGIHLVAVRPKSAGTGHANGELATR